MVISAPWRKSLTDPLQCQSPTDVFYDFSIHKPKIHPENVIEINNPSPTNNPVYNYFVGEFYLAYFYFNANL